MPGRDEDPEKQEIITYDIHGPLLVPCMCIGLTLLILIVIVLLGYCDQLPLQLEW